MHVHAPLLDDFFDDSSLYGEIQTGQIILFRGFVQECGIKV